jgi:hypothetical protein
MEIYVLSQTKLESVEAWQRAIDAEGFALTLDVSRPFARLEGYLPAHLKGELAGFECDHWDVEDVLSIFPEIPRGAKQKFCLAFRWGADVKACIGAFMAASAYARAADGVVLECEEGKVLSPDEAREETFKIERDIPEIEAMVQRAVEKFRK